MTGGEFWRGQFDNPTYPIMTYGELWRGSFYGQTYRIWSQPAFMFYPPRMCLQRLISRPDDDEIWTTEWGMQ